MYSLLTISLPFYRRALTSVVDRHDFYTIQYKPCLNLSLFDRDLHLTLTFSERKLRTGKNPALIASVVSCRTRNFQSPEERWDLKGSEGLTERGLSPLQEAFSGIVDSPSLELELNLKLSNGSLIFIGSQRNSRFLTYRAPETLT